MDNARARSAACAAFVAAAVLAAAAALAATTGEGGYEITRSQTVVPVPHGKIGRKTVDRETRVGNTEDTDGNSYTMTMTLGGFMRRCPAPDDESKSFVVTGDFEYSIVVDKVDTDVVPTKREHYEKRVTARIKVFVNDNLSITEGEIVGEYSAHLEGVRTGPIPIRKRFPIRANGTPDFGALLDITRATGDLAAAALMWNSSTTVLDLLRTLNKPNLCTELVFDPPSETRAVSPTESVEVKVKYRMLEGQQPVPRGTWEAVAGNGKVAVPKGTVPEDGSFVVRYSATSNPKAGDGFHVEGLSPAGVALEYWRIRVGLALAIEHRIATRRDSPRVRVGGPIYDGTVRFDVKLDPVPVPNMPGEFRGETSVVRQFSVGHITPRCAGQGSQVEEWSVQATVDPKSETIQLRIAMFPDEMDAWWICDGQRDEVTVPILGESNLDRAKAPWVLPSRSGSRQTFTPGSQYFEEFLTVTIR